MGSKKEEKMILHKDRKKRKLCEWALCILSVIVYGMG